MAESKQDQNPEQTLGSERFHQILILSKINLLNGFQNLQL